MEKEKTLVLSVEVTDQAAKFDLLSPDESEVLELTLYRQTYTNGEWVDDEEVKEQFYKDINDVFGVLTEDQLEETVDNTIEVYVKAEDGKAYVHEPRSLNLDKPELDEVGELESGKVAEIIDFDTKRILVFETEDGKRRPKNFNFGKYNKKLDKYLVSKVDLLNHQDKFKTLTGHDWDDYEAVIGKKGMVEIKSFKSGKKEIPFVDLKKLK